jgi:hypothetical protein
MVTIKGYGETGRSCIWCGREKEGVEIETNDRSFVGFLCFSDLKRMLRLKTGSGQAQGNTPAAAAKIG